MKSLIINTGQTIFFDDEDEDFIRKNGNYFKPSKRTLIYLTKREKINGVEKTIKLSNKLLEVEGKYIIKHINGNYCDFTKKNLKIISRSIAHAKEKLSKNNKSGIKGVWFDPAINKWSVRIKKDGKWYWGKRHLFKKDAIKACNDLYIKLFGEENILKQ